MCASGCPEPELGSGGFPSPIGLTLTALALCAISLYAQKAQDVEAWGKLDWRMTLEQAKNEYKGV